MLGRQTYVQMFVQSAASIKLDEESFPDPRYPQVFANIHGFLPQIPWLFVSQFRSEI